MSCPRTGEIDWAAYFTDPRGEEWADVRAHFPLCEDCSREVARWTALRVALADSGPSAHPDEGELLAFDRSPVELTALRQSQIEVHVAGCDRCRNELTVLNSMLPVEAPSRAASTAPARQEESARGAFGWLGALFADSPLLAYGGAAATILLGLAIAFQIAEPDPAEPGPRLALEEPSERPDPDPDEVGPQERDGGTQLAETPPTHPIPTDVPEESPVPEPSPPQLAETADTPPSEEDRVAEAPTGIQPKARTEQDRSPPPRELQLASLDLPLSPPVFDAEAFFPAGTSRIDVLIRGAESAAEIRVLAPMRKAVTFERSPRLYWHLSTASTATVELVLVDQASDEVVFEQILAPPVRSGLHVLDLAARQIVLEPRRSYVFFASIVPDPDRRDLDLTSGFTFESRPEDRPRPVNASEEAAALAGAGSWLDAFDTLQRWTLRDPRPPRVLEHRAALLEQVGRANLARALEAEEVDQSENP